MKMRRLDRWINYAGNHRSCFSFGIILIVIHLVLVAERVYQYRHSGAWIVIARSSGTTPSSHWWIHLLNVYV